jgi:putative two-component system response regulator
MTPATNQPLLASPEAFRIKLLEEQASLLRNSVICAFNQLLDLKDLNTGVHSTRLAEWGLRVGQELGLDENTLRNLEVAALLHDIGKVGIPDSILLKSEGLTAEEWVTMRSHTTRGVEICRHMKTLDRVLPIIRSHHERWDGSGYPDGLRREQTPLLARVLQIADIYDALISARPYKDAYEPERALRTIVEETTRGWRDPQIVEHFLRLHKDVISKVTDYTSMADRSLENLNAALSGLQEYLGVSSVVSNK